MTVSKITALAIVVVLAATVPAAARTPLQRDVEGYAIATCLGQQPSLYLKDQADGWGSIIVQRGHGGRAPMLALSAAVRAEAARTPVYQIADEQHPIAGKPMPIAYCAELIDRPRLRAAIARAAAALAAAYREAR